jgi:quercetin dioxygenase-like cupin family protein
MNRTKSVSSIYLHLMILLVCKGDPLSLYSWSRIPTEKLTDKLGRKLISGKNVMLAQIFLKKGSTVVAHSHVSEQFSYILKGSIKFCLLDKEIILNEGDVLNIPSGVEHSAVALEDTLSLDAFSPIREDWLNGTDAYLRR